MARLDDFFIKKPTKTAAPSLDEWVYIDPNGGGDFLNFNDAFDAGKKNMFFVAGNHYMTGDVTLDCATAEAREPIRIHGEDKNTTFLYFNQGTTLYFFDIFTTDSFSSSYDYSQEPPANWAEGQPYEISFYKGDNFMTATNFVWSDFNQLNSTAPEVGDFISLNNNCWYRIVDIQNDTKLVFDDYNTLEDYLGKTNFNKTSQARIEMVNISIGVTNEVSFTSSNGRDTIFYNQGRGALLQKTGIEWYIDEVDGDLTHNDGASNVTIVHSDGGLPSFVRRLKLTGG